MSWHDYSAASYDGVPVDATMRMPVPGDTVAQPGSSGYPGFRAQAGGDRQEFARPAPPERWPMLADDLFRILHDDGFNGGRLRVAEPIAAMGLAGALLAELAWCRRVDLTHDGTVVVADPKAPADAAAHTVLADISNEPARHPVATWVHYLARTSYQLVGKRMVQHGHVREEVSRRLFKTATTYVPVKIGTAAWPAARLVRAYGSDRLDTFDQVLTGLVCAVGLAYHVFHECDQAQIVALPRLLDPVSPPLPDLVRLVHATVGTAVMTAR